MNTMNTHQYLEVCSIIDQELAYWQNAYPKQKKLLGEFAKKIKVELKGAKE